MYGSGRGFAGHVIIEREIQKQNVNTAMLHTDRETHRQTGRQTDRVGEKRQC